MDWIAAVALIAGIILLIIGVGFVLNLDQIISLFEEIFGLLCIVLGVLALYFGFKLIRTA
jgi:hypothetical protein